MYEVLDKGITLGEFSGRPVFKVLDIDMNFADMGGVCHRIEGEEENVCYTRQV
jgi:hypothetical protein